MKKIIFITTVILISTFTLQAQTLNYCKGEKIELTNSASATNGTGVTYKWTKGTSTTVLATTKDYLVANSATTSDAGTYKLVVIKNGCESDVATIDVTVGDKKTPSFTQITPICSGDSFTLPTTSTNGVQGTWSPAINNTATTEYTFTPNSGECAETVKMTVTVNTKKTPSFTQITPICSGDSFTLPTTSTNGVQGTWSPAINNTATTEYTFTPNSGECAVPHKMTVEVKEKPTAIIKKK